METIQLYNVNGTVRRLKNLQQIQDDLDHRLSQTSQYLWTEHFKNKYNAHEYKSSGRYYCR